MEKSILDKIVTHEDTSNKRLDAQELVRAHRTVIQAQRETQEKRRRELVEAFTGTLNPQRCMSSGEHQEDERHAMDHLRMKLLSQQLMRQHLRTS